MVTKLAHKQGTSAFQEAGSPTNTAGNLIGELFYPNADDGTRNIYLTSLCGRLLATPVRPDAAYQALHLANSNLPTPLPDKEVNQIFKSILKRESEVK
ncbi:primase alpha helix C-terminal domain-containing protein [Secundilactobacillus similis]|uniref:primase alpha helix C-terminal domain-containing protein n=1 Tax=Secundilactobacillus similis TaxID=414682 RepID=UPI0006D22571|nr:primase alpha helix C-terminal domain-containing protein [Secundilactobacillus similis]